MTLVQGCIYVSGLITATDRRKKNGENRALTDYNPRPPLYDD